MPSVVKCGPGPNKVEKETKTVKKGNQKREPVRTNSMFFCNVFFCCFLEKSWELFFGVLVAEVSQMGATWGHFSRHVAAKVEN